MDDDTPARFITSQVFKIMVGFKVEPPIINKAVKELETDSGGRISLSQIAEAMSHVPQKGRMTPERWSDLNDRIKATLLVAPVQPPLEIDFLDLSLHIQVSNPPSFYGKTILTDADDSANSGPPSLAKNSSSSAVTRRGGVSAPSSHVQRSQGARMGEGCKLASPADRGITLAQLRALGAHVTRRCRKEAWVDVRGVKLSPAAVSLHDVCAYVTKPATIRRKCSYVELIAAGEQKSKYFVSHWWGQPILQLIGALEQHAKDRRLDINSTIYWVGALALNTYSEEEGFPDLGLSAKQNRKHDICKAVSGAMEKARRAPLVTVVRMSAWWADVCQGACTS